MEVSSLNSNQVINVMLVSELCFSVFIRNDPYKMPEERIGQSFLSYNSKFKLGNDGLRMNTIIVYKQL